MAIGPRAPFRVNQRTIADVLLLVFFFGFFFTCTPFAQTRAQREPEFTERCPETHPAEADEPSHTSRLPSDLPVCRDVGLKALRRLWVVKKKLTQSAA